MIVAMSADRGSVRWHRGGWEIRLQVDGRRVTRRVKAPNSRAGRREAEAQLEALATSMSMGTEAMTVGELLDAYELACEATWAPSTRASFPHHAAPVRAAIGDQPVGSLRPVDLDVLYGRWLAAGVAAGTVRRRHSVLAAALRRAEKWGAVAVSPARDVETIGRSGSTPPEVPDIAVAFDVIAGLGHRRLQVAAELAVATGARRGELCGLRWRDLDPAGPSLTFTTAISVGPGGELTRKGLKTDKPKRVAIDQPTAVMLAAWRKEARAAALAAGAGRIGPDDPILASPTDPHRPWAPPQLTQAWNRHRKGTPLAGVRWHAFRHLQATYLLAQGIPVHEVAARLGHDPVMTLRVYGHAIPANDRRSADAIATARTSR